MKKLDLHQYQGDFCAYVRNPRLYPRPHGTKARRIAVYAELVFNNIEKTLASCFPVSRKVLGARRWKRLVQRFLAEHQSKSPLFRQIPEEFLRWVETVQDDTLPPFLHPLAHYEWVELAISVSDAEPEVDIDPQGDLLAQIPVLVPALMLLAYQWPVQLISAKFQPEQPLSEPQWLLVFRNAQDEVRFMELNPVSARLVTLLQDLTLTGREALIQVADALHHPDQALVVSFGAEVLSELRAQGAIMGTARCK